MVYITNTTISIPGTRMTHLVEVLISKMEGFTSGLGRFWRWIPEPKRWRCLEDPLKGDRSGTSDLLERHGKSMENQWKINGKSMENQWNVMENQWNIMDNRESWKIMESHRGLPFFWWTNFMMSHVWKSHSCSIYSHRFYSRDSKGAVADSWWTFEEKKIPWPPRGRAPQVWRIEIHQRLHLWHPTKRLRSLLKTNAWREQLASIHPRWVFW